MKTAVLEGKNIKNLKSFYDEVEKKLTSGLGWKIGRNLDAFNDILKGDFGIHGYGKELLIVWNDSDFSREKLGHKETIKYLNDIMKKCHPSNLPDLRKRLKLVEKGQGETLFDTILDIISTHPYIKLELKTSPAEKTKDSEKKKFSTPDEYIEMFPKHIQKKLKEIRKEIRKTVPDAEEKISYQMPCFALNGILVWYAGYEKHIGFYPSSSGIAKFQKEISKYKNSKGAVQFPLDEPLPMELIKKIVLFRVKENSAKKEKKT